MGPRAQTGKKVRPATTNITPMRSPAKRVRSVGKVPAEAGTVCLRTSEPAIASTGMIEEEPPNKHRQPKGRGVEAVGGGQPGEGAAVVVPRRGEGVEDLGEAVRAGVELPLEAGG